MAKICFPCVLSVSWTDPVTLSSLSFSSWLFSHLSFHHFTIQNLWGLFLWPGSLSSRKEASLWIPISCRAVKLHLGDSVHWTIIECLCNSVFRRCWLLNSRNVCIFTLWLFPVMRKQCVFYESFYEPKGCKVNKQLQWSPLICGGYLAKTPSWCLDPWIVPNSIWIFSVHT